MKKSRAMQKHSDIFSYNVASKIARTSLNIYIIITVVITSYIAKLFLSGSHDTVEGLMYAGPISILAFTNLYLIFTWILIGSMLYLVSSKTICKKNLFFFSTFYFYAFLYLNILRERTLYGDVGDYVKAAFNIYNGEIFHNRYLYPPLWANILTLLTPFGKDGIIISCMFLNYLSLLLFFALLYKSLQNMAFQISSLF